MFHLACAKIRIKKMSTKVKRYHVLEDAIYAKERLPACISSDRCFKYAAAAYAWNSVPAATKACKHHMVPVNTFPQLCHKADFLHTSLANIACFVSCIVPQV